MKPTKRKRECEEESVEQAGGLETKFINAYIGSGVFAKAYIQKGSFVCTYTGKNVSGKEGEVRLKASNGPCYLYFFKANGIYLCVDGTMSSCIGKYRNDDHTFPNCKVVRKGQDLAIFADRDIVQGGELRYDYGDKGSFWKKKNQQREALHDLPSEHNSVSRDWLFDMQSQNKQLVLDKYFHRGFCSKENSGPEDSGADDFGPYSDADEDNIPDLETDDSASSDVADSISDQEHLSIGC